MSHLRMSSEEVVKRSITRPFRRGLHGENEWMFTQSLWYAQSFLSRVEGGEPRLILEGGYIDPHGLFPDRVMRMVDNGIARVGLVAEVTRYVFEGGEVAGAILLLHIETRDIGYYAVKPPQEKQG